MNSYEEGYLKGKINALENLVKELKQQLAEKEKEIKQLERECETWKKACELACIEVPTNHCPDPPEYYDASNEYGSDEPFYIEEGGCEFPDHCLDCYINYFYEEAQKTLEILEKI